MKTGFHHSFSHIKQCDFISFTVEQETARTGGADKTVWRDRRGGVWTAQETRATDARSYKGDCHDFTPFKCLYVTSITLEAYMSRSML